VPLPPLVHPTSGRGEPSTVDITRSTVPGVGTVHHVHTLGGRLHIVIEPDEADEPAEVLQNRPLSDRLGPAG
jgi:hypothetical protein